MRTIEKFFEDYAMASMGNDAGKLASFYAANFMTATKDRSAAFSNDEKFISWLNGVFKFNKESGLQSMKLKEVAPQPIGKYFLNVTVIWQAVFAAKPEEPVDFAIHYILNRVEDDYRIVLYISEEDQEELMKKKGLI